MIDRRLLLRRIRFAVYGVALVLVLVLVLRFETIRLPAEGCSPLRAFEPGTRLLLDRWGGAREGDAVIFRHAGELLLGRVEPAPSDLPPGGPGGTWAPADADHLWIVADAPDCPARDSRVLGPIPRGEVVARIVLGLPW